MFESINDGNLWHFYNVAKNDFQDFDFADLDQIFNVALANRALFPNVARNTEDEIEYFKKWISRYKRVVECLPSEKTARPKNSCSDPAVRKIVEMARCLSNEEAMQLEKNHNLFMSAENIQGNLLEEYIANKIKPYGFLWAAGTVLRSVDFCNVTGTCLLQVKNKFNTENSSSNQIRNGTDIKKWFRLGERTCDGRHIPDYKWDYLNSLINENSTMSFSAPCDMSEDEYIEFIHSIAIQSPDIITDE